MRFLSVVFVFIIGLGLLFPHAAMASVDVELVMFSVRGCGHCRKFKREVLPGYARSRAAKKAPLRLVDAHGAGLKGHALRRPVRFAPTFVLFRRGREVARMVGYFGKGDFYRRLARMMKRNGI